MVIKQEDKRVKTEQVKQEIVKSEGLVKDEAGQEIDVNDYLEQESIKAMGVIADELPNSIIESFVKYIGENDEVSAKKLGVYTSEPVKDEKKQE